MRMIFRQNKWYQVIEEIKLHTHEVEYIILEYNQVKYLRPNLSHIMTIQELAEKINKIESITWKNAESKEVQLSHYRKIYRSMISHNRDMSINDILSKYDRNFNPILLAC